MTPKKTFGTMVVLALVVALGLAVGVLPGAGLMSLRQIVLAQEVYTLVSIDVDNDANPRTAVPDPLTLMAGEQVRLNAVGTYTDGTTEYTEDLIPEVDVLYSVAPFSLGTIEANSSELRVRFTANPNIEDDPLEGTVTALSTRTEVSSDPLNITVNPFELTVDFVTPLDGSTLYIGASGTTDVPVRAESSAPWATARVDFFADDGDIGSDETEPYDTVVVLDSADFDPDADPPETVTFVAELFGLDDEVVPADTDTAVVSVVVEMLADADGNGVPDDPFAVDDGISYVTVGDVNVMVADITDVPIEVVTVDGIGIELPEDIYENILDEFGNPIDPALIGEVRLIVRTAPDILDILAAEPRGLPELAELIGNVLDIHMLVMLDGVETEVHDFDVPITISIPVSADFAQLWGADTEFDLELDPPTYDPVVAGRFGLVQPTIEAEGRVFEVEVYEFTTYVPVADPATPQIDTVEPNQGSELGNTPVKIIGDNFETNAGVTFGGVAATVTSVVDSIYIYALTPAHAVGVVDVTVTNPDTHLSNTLMGGYEYIPVITCDAPVIARVNPDWGWLDQNTNVTISGANFEDASVVQFGTIAASTFTISPDGTEIDVTVVPQAAGRVGISVTTPCGTGTLPDAFEFMSPDIVLSVADVVGMPGDEMPVVISLENVNAPVASSVTLSLLYDPAVLEPTSGQLAERGQAADDASKNVDVNVVNPGEVRVVISGGQGVIGDGEVAILNFTAAAGLVRQRSVLDLTNMSAADPAANPLVVGGYDGEAIIGSQPTIESVDGPRGQYRGWPGDEVVITGSGFDDSNSAEVYFGTVQANTITLTATSITVVVPDQIPPAVEGDQVDLSVLNPDENLRVVAANQFLYTQRGAPGGGGSAGGWGPCFVATATRSAPNSSRCTTRTARRSLTRPRRARRFARLCA